ncbi:hypothetical protein FIBSPDRAFT_859983 [Athelia psychrophila]|uniref:Uncharacterized protein n=1 Tax=Athelia psychrophila TaxID=1759441 RepID=A0A166KNL7_9AGAM|nr:hypothetical protein FIBSPDRAFT_859978 [Fibularhizoctonia sp. CBS 109695]KZP22098.1 hypothetical protein FIBSPDRAFT_859983 [Fibularhizoctonia sp. CBS 109695]
MPAAVNLHISRPGVAVHTRTARVVHPHIPYHSHGLLLHVSFTLSRFLYVDLHP